MDIFNDKERPIVCVCNDIESTFPGYEHEKLLAVGQTYTLVDVEVHSWHTLVTLREFPGVQFNSCLFDEVGDTTCPA